MTSEALKVDHTQISAYHTCAHPRSLMSSLIKPPSLAFARLFIHRCSCQIRRPVFFSQSKS